ncbi:inositol monophosphatase family protein [Terricaulis silvestris]|uniref:Inositol-1-monophosphatase n=1 Tax=Terricaulis silvestris TaxID=2686094 RepID=A0A6I6MME1_9CAUL|nr:inositol monophosphatase family protein [Terricaulis silvestris]QGZ94498.1 Inositol-1-monophosphatase [Terricaulis silvestris]
MTLQSAASELSLLEEAAREAGALARSLLLKPLEVQSKGAAGPVTNVDFAVDAFLEEKLLGARPDYGWLSEETPDQPIRRIGKARTFMIDPIDGTAAMIGRAPQWTISIGIVEGERAFAGAVYNPMTDEMFVGAISHGATLNGRPAHVTTTDKLEGARMIAQLFRFTPKRWPTPWPKMDVIERQSIAYRMALVAAGLGDAALLFGFKHEWDIAAGAALVEAAGGVVTDLWGEPLRFNQYPARAPGVALSGAALHPLLIERSRAFPDPRATP